MRSEVRLRLQARAFFQNADQLTRRVLYQEIDAFRNNPTPDHEWVAVSGPDKFGRIQYNYAQGPWLITFVLLEFVPEEFASIVVTGIIHDP